MSSAASVTSSTVDNKTNVPRTASINIGATSTAPTTTASTSTDANCTSPCATQQPRPTAVATPAPPPDAMRRHTDVITARPCSTTTAARSPHEQSWPEDAVHTTANKSFLEGMDAELRRATSLRRTTNLNEQLTSALYIRSVNFI